MCADGNELENDLMANQNERLFRGAGVALLTLFDDTGALLVEDTVALAVALADKGAACVLVAGTTGEFWTLEAEERLELVAAVRAALPAAVPVMAGIGALDQHRALALAAQVGATGADAALCFTPRGADPVGFYDQVRQNVGAMPLLAYHFPAVGYTPLDVELLGSLPIDGIKDSSGEPPRLLATSRVLPAGVYTGSALLATLAAALPVDGAILAVGNLEPALAQAAVHGDTAAQGELAQLHVAISGDAPPRALKRLAAQRYGTPPFTRSPALADAT